MHHCNARAETIVRRCVLCTRAAAASWQIYYLILRSRRKLSTDLGIPAAADPRRVQTNTCETSYKEGAACVGGNAAHCV